MGLDMWLEREHFVWSKDRETLEISGVSFEVDPKKVSIIVEEAGYWRKANAIHRWFVENIQGGKDDCGRYYVERSKLAELLKLVVQVMDNHDLGGAILPTQSGFFFGGTAYDKWYFDNLQRTVDIIKPILQDGDNGDIYYHSSW